jgi:hypothetical protein
MSGRTNACCARHCQLPQLHRRTAFLKTSSACIVGSRRCRSLGRCCRATRESSRSTSASPTRWCAFGANGCLAVIVEAWSRGPASTNCWRGTHCLRSRFSMATPPRANLSREEPDAGNLHVPGPGSRSWFHPFPDGAHPVTSLGGANSRGSWDLDAHSLGMVER